jgi:hypothetical protein
MKLALIFLSVMVAITNQQFQRQRERIGKEFGGPRIITRHSLPSTTINEFTRIFWTTSNRITVNSDPQDPSSTQR